MAVSKGKGSKNKTKKAAKKLDKQEQQARLEEEALESTRLVVATAQLELLRYLESAAGHGPLVAEHFTGMIENIGAGRAPTDFNDMEVPHGDPAAG